MVRQVNPRRLRKRVRPEKLTKESVPLKGFEVFSVAHHRKFLRLDDPFLRSLTSQSRVLEIGFGSGRLANFLLKNSQLKPENFHLMDKEYIRDLPYLNRLIRQLISKGRIKAVVGEMEN